MKFGDDIGLYFMFTQIKKFWKYCVLAADGVMTYQ